jgi:hypothetical protein
MAGQPKTALGLWLFFGVFGVLLFVTFRSLSFNLSQSLVLSILFAFALEESLFGIVRAFQPQDVKKWRPVQIVLWPDISRMLYDLGVFSTSEEWEHMHNHPRRGEVTVPDRGISGQGIQITILCQETEQSEAVFLYQNPFTGSIYAGSKLEYEEELLEIMIPNEFGGWSEWASLPEFFLCLSEVKVADSLVGYGFGLRVHESWWNQACKNKLVQESVLKAESGKYGRIDLIFGVIPYWEMFGLYYRTDSPAYYSLSEWKKYKQRQSRDEKVLADYGWTQMEYGARDSKYMRISHHSF